MTNSLKKIINDKKIVIEKYKKNLSLEYLEKKISLYKDYLDFKSKLMENKISVIAEIKS